MADGTGLLTRRGSNTSVSSNLTVSAIQCGISLMVKLYPSKLVSSVRFRYPAPCALFRFYGGVGILSRS